MRIRLLEDAEYVDAKIVAGTLGTKVDPKESTIFKEASMRPGPCYVKYFTPVLFDGDTRERLLSEEDFEEA
jgi:hypothetical protein